MKQGKQKGRTVSKGEGIRDNRGRKGERTGEVVSVTNEELE